MKETSPAVERRDLIEGLGKGLRVIEAFGDDEPRLTPTQVAQRTGITRTAARRYLLSLVHYGYAATDGRQFWLRPRVLRLGESYLASARLPRLVQPFIQRVSLQTGETVNFSVLDGHEIVYLARSNPPRFLSIGYQVGTRVPAHVVCPGFVLAGLMDDAALDDWIAAHDWAVFTPHTLVDPQRFRRLARQARTQGHWVAEQMLDPGLRGVAVPLRDRRGEPCGAVGMTVQVQAHSPEQVLERLLPALQQVAAELRPLL